MSRPRTSTVTTSGFSNNQTSHTTGVSRRMRAETEDSMDAFLDDLLSLDFRGKRDHIHGATSTATNSRNTICHRPNDSELARKEGDADSVQNAQAKDVIKRLKSVTKESLNSEDALWAEFECGLQCETKVDDPKIQDRYTGKEKEGDTACKKQKDSGEKIRTKPSVVTSNVSVSKDAATKSKAAAKIGPMSDSDTVSYDEENFDDKSSNKSNHKRKTLKRTRSNHAKKSSQKHSYHWSDSSSESSDGGRRPVIKKKQKSVEKRPGQPQYGKGKVQPGQKGKGKGKAVKAEPRKGKTKMLDWKERRQMKAKGREPSMEDKSLDASFSSVSDVFG